MKKFQYNIVYNIPIENPIFMIIIIYDVPSKFIHTLSEKATIEFRKANFPLQNLLCHISLQYSHFEIGELTFSDIFVRKNVILSYNVFDVCNILIIALPFLNVVENFSLPK